MTSLLVSLMTVPIILLHVLTVAVSVVRNGIHSVFLTAATSVVRIMLVIPRMLLRHRTGLMPPFGSSVALSTCGRSQLVMVTINFSVPVASAIMMSARDLVPFSVILIIRRQ
ncbi:hypothetical protein ACOMHN_052664 [Nucella lapillus]